jgi:hypothetical protein
MTGAVELFRLVPKAHATLSMALAMTMVTVCLAGRATPLYAQGVEIVPFGGYRFGGDFFEAMAGQRVDVDGSPALGVVVNVPLSDGFQVEGVFTQQRATVPAPGRSVDAPANWNATVAHAQVGGLQEFSNHRVRPFLTGVLGLTRYAAEGDGEVRFTVGAGGGVKLLATSHVGLRLDGRVYTTFVDADARFVACGAGTCVTALHADLVWQAEFTAGVMFRLR